MGRKHGFSFSWRRATGLSAAKGRLSRAIGVPLTKSGRQKKLGRAVMSLGIGALFAPAAAAARRAPTRRGTARAEVPSSGIGGLVVLAVLGFVAYRFWPASKPAGEDGTRPAAPPRWSSSPLQSSPPSRASSPHAESDPGARPAPTASATEPSDDARARAIAELDASSPEYRVYKMYLPILRSKLERARAAGDPAADAIATDYERTLAKIKTWEDAAVAKGK